MKKFLITATITYLFFASRGQNSIVAIKDVAIVDVTNGKIKKEQTVLIEGNKIAATGTKANIPPTALVIDGRGKYLIPGLWDMHAHSFTDRTFTWLFPLLIANGVTGVRDMATTVSFDSIRMIRNEILEGKIIGPRFGATTQRIVGWTTSPGIMVSGPDQARELVRTYKHEGMDFMKVYNLLSREAYLAIIDEAKQQHMPVAGHIPFALTAREASDFGQISIEHNIDLFLSCSSNETALRQEMQAITKTDVRPAMRQPVELKAMKTYDENKAAAFFNLLKKNGTWICPTLVVFPRITNEEDEMAADSRMKYIPVAFRQRWSNQMKQRIPSKLSAEEKKLFVQKNLTIVTAMYRAGVGIIAGSDMMIPYMFPGFSLHDELELMVEGGLSPLEALQTATINPAKFLHREKEFGTIEKGKYADLVLLDANPLENISNTKKINAVIANGRLFQRVDLERLLAGVENIAKETAAR